MTSRPAATGRGRAAALGAVLVLLVVAVVVGLRAGGGGAGAAAAPAPDLAPLRAAAGLPACPAGLGPALPDVTLPCLGGGPAVALRSGPPGRPTLVNVWGTWCPPCVEEAPLLAGVAAGAGDRLGLVGVLTQDTERNGLEFARQFGIRYPNLVDDDGAVLRAFLPGPPVTLFLDAQGRVVFRKNGKFADAAQIRALVAEHLGVVL